MHYCFLCFGSINNPGYVRAKHLATELINRGHTVSYVLDDGDQHQRSDVDERALVHFVENARGLRQFDRRRRAIKALRPDYVEVHNPHPKTLVPLMALRGSKVVGFWDEPPFTKNLGWRAGTLHAVLRAWLMRRGDVHLASTITLQQLFRERYGIEALHQQFATYLPEYPDGPSPFTEPTAVYLGNFAPLWDHDIFFDAYDLLAKRGVKPKMVMMGGGYEMARWQTFIEERGLDNIELAGYATGEALWQRLRHAHVLLFPMRDTLVNRCRCSSKTFAYAQARRPVITTRVGEIPYILGDKAEYVEATPVAFADAIEKAVGQPRQPDVQYDLRPLTWAARADQLLEGLARS